jgi:hypothetical protein
MGVISVIALYGRHKVKSDQPYAHTHTNKHTIHTHEHTNHEHKTYSHAYTHTDTMILGRHRAGIVGHLGRF